MAARKDVRLTVLNEGEILKAFEAQAGKMQKRVLKRAARAAAEPVIQRAGQLAPRRRGELAGSIVAKRARIEEGRAVVDVGPDSDHFYGLFQEFGTGHHRAQPFLRPAVDETEHEAQAAARAVVREELGL